MSRGSTYGEALAAARAALAGLDPKEAARDARLLLAAAAEIEMAEVIAKHGQAVPELERERFDSYIERRTAGEPVARILGAADFWGMALRLNAATLVPRPDTETLVEVALAEARRREPATLTICDLGTGSGAVVIALLAELPNATAVAADIAEEALLMARINAEAHGVAGRVRFERVDFAEGPAGRFDLVVSNPPYVRSGDIDGLAREVREHDPHAALDGGADGLGAYRTILRRAGRLLAEDGFLALEVGAGQAESVAALCRDAGFREVATHADLSGHKRVVTACETMLGINSGVAKKALGKVE